MAIPGMSGAAPMDPKDPIAPTGGPNPTAPSDPLPLVDADGGDGKTAEQKKKEAAAKAALTQTIANGDAVYSQSNIVGDALGLIFDKKVGNYVVIDNLPEGTTLGDIRKKYNLPPGSLRHMVASGGGDFDTYKTEGYVHIYASDLAEGLGISGRELKGMFPEKQFSPWYKAGTNE